MVDTAAAQLLSPGVHTDTLRLFTNAGTVKLRVRINVQLPYLETSPDSVFFGYSAGTRPLVVRNSGSEPSVWTLASENAWLQGSPAAGILRAHDSIIVSLTADRAGLPDGWHAGAVVVSGSFNQQRRVKASLQVYHEPFRRLGHGVKDAEYSRQRESIVMVCDQPNRLYTHDPETGAETSVALPLPPSCVSVSPDGQYAAVGHNGFISYIDLAAGTLVEVCPVTWDVLDVVLAGNGYVYAFPRVDQWERIRCVRLSDSVETTHTGSHQIYAGTKAKMQPAGQYLYTADNGLSPNNMEKYYIGAGTAVYSYASPYWGDYDFRGDLWFSEDGLRIFAKSGNIFRSSTVQAQDMTYNGCLSGILNICFIGWLTHSQAAGKVFVAPVDSWYSSNMDTLIQIYDDDYLNYEQGLPLSKYLANGVIYKAHARYVFVNSAGTRFYVVQQADPAASLLLDFAVAAYGYPIQKRTQRRW
jgi:hypothetical protein